jgi:hypothetical protein
MRIMDNDSKHPAHAAMRYMRDHFSKVTHSEFIKNVREACDGVPEAEKGPEETDRVEFLRRIDPD